MKYLYQLLLILSFTLLGETMAWLVPLPIPAAVWGLVLLFLALVTRIVKVEWVRACGDSLIGNMGILFVATTVNLISYWDQIAPLLIPITVIVVGSTVVVFGVSGLVAKALNNKEEPKQ